MPRTAADTMKWNDLPGVVTRRGQKASSRWLYQGRNYRRTHPLPFHPSNRSTIKKLHRQFVNEVVDGTYKTAEQARRPDRVHPAVTEFFRARKGDMTAASADDYARSFSYFLDRNLPLSHDSLYRQALDRLDTPPEGRQTLAPETLRKYLIRLRSFGQWLADRGYLDRSPYATISTPPAPATRKRVEGLFTLREVLQMASWHRHAMTTCRNRRESFNHAQQAIAIELAYLTGMRPSELCRARFEDIGDRVWTIWGKASPAKSGQAQTRNAQSYRQPRQTRDQHARIRHFPIGRAATSRGLRARWQRRLSELIEEARSHTDATDGWVIATKYPQVLNRGVAAALDGLGIDRGDRTFRRLRHSSRRMMEETLRIDPLTIADLLGHSPEVSLLSYRAEPTADDIAERLHL